MEKQTFIFRKEWRDAAKDLPIDIRAEIYEAIIEYALTGTIPVGLKPIANAVFTFIKERIDYETSISLKRSVAGRKGGAPKGNLNAKKQAKQAKNNQKQPKTSKGCLEEGPFIPPNEETPPDPPKEVKPPIIPQEEGLALTGLSTDVDSEDNSAGVCKQVMDFYNKSVKGKMMSRCVKLTEKRKQAIKARVYEYGLPGVFEAITIAANSDFCNGHNDRNWVADFDFVFNVNKMAKLLENKYNNRNGTTQTHQRDYISDEQVIHNTLGGIIALNEKERLGGNEQVPF